MQFFFSEQTNYWVPFSLKVYLQAYYECFVFCCDLFAKLQLQVHHHINAYGCFNIQLAFHTSCSSSARKTCECTINCFMKWSLFSYLQKLHWSILLFNRWLKKFWPEKLKVFFVFVFCLSLFDFGVQKMCVL